MSVCVCKFPKWEFKSRKGKKENQKQFIFHFHCYTMSSQDRIRQSFYEQVATFIEGKNWQPLTICNIAQAGSLCVSNKYLTALFRSNFPVSVFLM